MSFCVAAAQSRVRSFTHLKKSAAVHPCSDSEDIKGDSSGKENDSSVCFAAAAQCLQPASETEDEEKETLSELESDHSASSEDASYRGEMPRKGTQDKVIQKLANGVKYNGPLKNGEYHGTGTAYFYKEGALVKSYAGGFKASNFHGKGRIIYYGANVNVKYFAGNFSNGKIYGTGYLIFQDKTIISGFFYYCPVNNGLVVKKTDGSREVLSKQF